MKKRIRFFINTLSGGGAEKVLIDLLRQLPSEKYDISLLTIEGGVHEINIPPYVSHKKILKNSKSKFLKKVIYHLPRKLFTLLFMRGKYDIEIAYLEGTPTRFLAALSTKAKKIAFVHFDISNKNLIKSFYKTKEECWKEYQAFTNVCFVSKKSKFAFEKTIGKLDHALVVHNVLDYNKIRELAEKPCALDYNTKGLKLISVGRLISLKGYERLIKILSELEKKYDFELWILGEGEEREHLERIIKEKGIDSVKLLGYQSNPYMYIKKSDLLISASFSEGYSTVVTEAISLGIPVLTTATAGMEEILRDGLLGEIVDNSDEGIKSGLLSFLKNRSKYIDLKEVVESYNKKNPSRSALNEYTELLNM